MSTCAVCGFVSEQPFRFCPSCGTEAAAEASHGQRRTVTVAFCDLAGSTSLGESIDPERLRTVLARYFERMKGIVESHGGTVEKFIGDAVMAVFGVPLVHEDDALRAVRAATEMRDALPELGLEGRIGVMTGEVVTGTAERLVTGDAVNVAARLEQSAAPGEVLIGDPTLELVGAAVEVEAVAPLTLKGKAEPVPAYRLLAVRDAPERRHETPFVGRQAELTAIHDAFDRTREGRNCELVTVLGEAGIGKSRLVNEALPATGARVVRGRCLPYGEGITYWPVVEILKQLDLLPPDEAAAGAIRALLGQSDAPTSADEIAWAFRKTLEHAADEEPLIVVLDDIQWGEQTFLELIEHVALLSSGSPILLLCMARPELAEQRPTWPVTLRLTPLAAAEAETLIGRHLDSDVRHRIAEAAGGNPLFLTEMLAMAAGTDGDVIVPPNLRALLETRLDQLEPAERAVLERGAVEGEVFHRGAVQATAPSDTQVAPRLAALMRKDLIRPDAPLVASDDGFRFRHLLIRDTAYESLPKAVRADLHERFAAWLEQHGPDLVELDEILGHHYEQACRYLRELGDDVALAAALAARASAHLAAAGRRAIGRQDYRAAVSLLDRAARVLPDEACDPRLEVDLGWCRYQVGEGRERVLVGFLDAAERAARAGDETGALGLRVDHAAYEVAFEGSSAVADRARVVADDARPVFEAAGDDWGLSLVYTAILMAQEAQAAPWAEILATAERIVTHARRAGADMIAAFGEGYHVAAQQEGPTPVAECLRWLDEHPHIERRSVLPMRSRFLAMLGKFDEARELQARSAERLAELGSVRGRSILALRRYYVSILEGDYAAAEAAAGEMHDGMAATGELVNAAWAGTLRAQAVLELGRTDEADEVLERALVGTTGDESDLRMLARRVRARICARRGEHAEAERLAREAVEIGDATDALNLQGDAYADLGEVLSLTGEPAEATSAWEQARERFERKGNVVMAERMRERLASLEAEAATGR